MHSPAHSTSQLVPHGEMSLTQHVDYGRVVGFANRWKDSPLLHELNRAVADDLAWHAMQLQDSETSDASASLAVQEITCHLCRLMAATKLPPCRSEGCALHAPELTG